MTLKEWCEKYNRTTTCPTDKGAVSIVLNTEDPAFYEIVTLLDYKVETQTNLPSVSLCDECYRVLWLLPRTKTGRRMIADNLERIRVRITQEFLENPNDKVLQSDIKALEEAIWYLDN